MRFLRTGLVLGLVIAASACGGDDESASTTLPPVSTTAPTTPETTEPTTPPTTSAPSTTAPATVPATTAPATTEPPATTDPSVVTTQPAATTEPPTTTATPTMVDVKVYFFRGERLEIAHRLVEGPAVLRGALTEVLAGPTAEDRASDLTSVIPTGTTLRDVSLADGQAIVDLSGEFESGGGSMSMLGRLGQVIFTATQFDNVDRVLFRLDGEPVEFLGGEGIVLGEPQTRSDVPREFTGGIIIDAPEPGATVQSPFTVTGEGDLFEGYSAMWAWRDGERIAAFGVNAGAWGMWDEFETTVTLDVPPGPITLIVDDGNGCTPGDPECGEPNPAIVDVDLA